MAFGIYKKLKNIFPLISEGGIINFMKLIKFRLSKKKTISLKLKGNRKRAYISYIPESLIRQDAKYLNLHQNRREMKIIAETFLANGYDVIVQEFTAPIIDDSVFDVVFGLEPNFTTMARRTLKARHISYATGAYSPFANNAIEKRTNEFNQKHSANIPPRRVCMVDEAPEIADIILQIGSKFTIQTYPSHLQGKIRLINQSSNYLPSQSLDLRKPDKHNFLWLASSGSILKGVDLVIEAFMQHPELSIDIVGPVEQDILKYFPIDKYPNIRIHGFIDVNTPEFQKIITSTAFLLYPSATEGAPGAVNVAMKNGIIPLTSSVASPDDIDRLGFMIKSLDSDGIEEALSWSQTLSDEEIKRLHNRNIEYAKRWSLDNFKDEFNRFLHTLSD